MAQSHIDAYIANIGRCLDDGHVYKARHMIAALRRNLYLSAWQKDALNKLELRADSTPLVVTSGSGNG